MRPQPLVPSTLALLALAVAAAAAHRPPTLARAGGSAPLAPSSAWGDAALAELGRAPLTNPRNSRALAALHVAIRHAVATARARTGGAPSALERGAAAGAARAVLDELVPTGASRWPLLVATERDLAPEAAASFEDGLHLGLDAARPVLARVRSDDAREPGETPAGPGRWSGTPIEPAAAAWRPWILGSAADFRPAPPPAPDSPDLGAELVEVLDAPRDEAHVRAALYWQTFEGIFTEWYRALGRGLAAQGLDRDALASARAHATVAMAHHDAILAAWDAKFAYGAIRPFQLDGRVKPLFPTPAHPSYPAAHAVASTAVAETIAGLFPELAMEVRARAVEAAESRIWAGVHFRSDLEAGSELGRRVALAVLAHRDAPAAERVATAR